MPGEQISPDIRCQFFQVEFGKIHARIGGVNKENKPPLVCLHMAPQSGQDFETFMAEAGRDRLVVAADYFGYGDSDPLPDGVAATIEIYAGGIWQVLDNLGIKVVEILGYHTGSKVAIEMALQRPNAVRGIMCIALSTMSAEDYSNSKPSFLQLSEASMGVGFVGWRQMLKDYYDPDLSPEKLDQKFAISLKSGAQFSSGFAASHVYNAQILSKLKMLKAPVILVNPNDDLREITPGAAKYIEHCILIEKPTWLPGFLEKKPKEVLSTLNQAFPLHP